MWKNSSVEILNAFPKRIQDPAEEPVSVEWLTSHLRFDIGDEDNLVAGYIKAARDYYEEITRTAFITQTWEIKLNKWWVDDYVIPSWPVQSIESIIYTKDDDSTSLDVKSLFELDLYSDPCFLRLADGGEFPSDLKTGLNVITIQYKAGFGDEETDVPEAIRHAIRLRASSFFKNRTDFEINQMLSAADALIQPFKRIRV